LLRKDGWQVGRKATHGMTLIKRQENRILVTFIPNKKVSLPEGTLRAIIGNKQTQIGKDGLLKLLNFFGLD
jgi:hypothetical protein